MPLNSGLLAGAAFGQALSGGVDTFLKARQQRQANEQQQNTLGLLAREHGLEFDPESGTITQSQQGLLDKDMARRKQESEITENEAKANYYNRPPKDPMAAFEFRDAQLAKREHNKLIRGLDSNATLRNQLTQITNMRNAITLTENAVKEGKPITQQQFHDLQQSVIGSLGIKGQQSVGEREAKLFNSLGMNGGAMVQFLTGQAQDIGKDNPLYKHVLDLARWESGNIGKQYNEQLDNLTSGYGWIYEENPRLKKDLDEKIRKLSGSAMGRQFQGEDVERGGTGGLLPPGGIGPQPAGGWTPDKEAKLQALRAKVKKP